MSCDFNILYSCHKQEWIYSFLELIIEGKSSNNNVLGVFQECLTIKLLNNGYFVLDYLTIEAPEGI